MNKLKEYALTVLVFIIILIVPNLIFLIPNELTRFQIISFLICLIVISLFLILFNDINKPLYKTNNKIILIDILLITYFILLIIVKSLTQNDFEYQIVLPTELFLAILIYIRACLKEDKYKIVLN